MLTKYPKLQRLRVDLTSFLKPSMNKKPSFYIKVEKAPFHGLISKKPKMGRVFSPANFYSISDIFKGMPCL